MASEIQYRRDIDGLRGLAVTSVVFFHTGLSAFQGGYVGVDVFFVISGFLITSIIREKLAQGQFSFIEFYAARARRIMPALIAMLTIVTIACLFVLLPDELAAYGKNLVQSLFFTVNIFLWRETGYFDLAAALRPLLHLWSLAVEEQFYIFWPLLLWLVARYRKDRMMLAATVTIMVASLGISQWGAIYQPSGAFYLAPSRAWELMLGALVAAGTRRPALRIGRECGAVSGLLLIAYAVFYFDHTTPFPGFHALIPCLGAALIIWSGGQTFTSRLLAATPVVAVGLVSYSLYLWHWPLLILGALWLNRPLTGLESAFAIAAGIVMATMSWFFVEQPFRRLDLKRRAKPILLWAAAAVVPLTLAGAVLAFSNGLPSRFSSAAMAQFNRSQQHTAIWSRCHMGEGASIPPIRGCLVGADGQADAYNAVLWGDSHADALEPAVEIFGRRQGLRIRQMTKSSCPPVVNVRPGTEKTPSAQAGCIAFNNAALMAITRTLGIKMAIITMDWQYNFAALNGGDASSDDLLYTALSREVHEITARGIRVLLIGEVPTLPQDTARCLLRGSLFNLNWPRCKRVDESATSPERARAFDRVIAAAAASDPMAQAIFPRDTLCTGKTCLAERGGASLYRDQDHLSIAGAEIFASLMKEPPNARR